MKKIITFVLILVGVVGVLRFVEVEVINPQLAKPEVHCNDAGKPNCAIFDEIQFAYSSEIIPIFETKCAACHGQVSHLPLYTKLPGVSSWLQHERDHSKEYLDTSYDFPFASTKWEDQAKILEEISEVVEEGSMPPWTYKLMHWQSGLTPAEREKILSWSQAGQAKLKKEQ